MLSRNRATVLIESLVCKCVKKGWSEYVFRNDGRRRRSSSLWLRQQNRVAADNSRHTYNNVVARHSSSLVVVVVDDKKTTLDWIAATTVPLENINERRSLLLPHVYNLIVCYNYRPVSTARS